MGEKTEEKWVVPQKNFEETNIETASFIFKQAEEKLKATIAVIDVLDQKIFKIITWMFPVLSGLVAWIILKGFCEMTLVFGILGMLIPLSISLFVCVYEISPKLFYGLGNEPKKLFELTLPNTEVPGRTAVQTILAECQNYQEYISDNHIRINEKGKTLKRSIQIMSISPFIGLLFFAVSYYF